MAITTKASYVKFGQGGVKYSLTLRERFAYWMYNTAKRLMPNGMLQDIRTYPVGDRPPRDTFSLTKELDRVYSDKVNARVKVDWDAVAVQCFQKWLARNQDRFPEQYEALSGDDKYINDQLADAAKAIFTGYYQRQLAARKS